MMTTNVPLSRTPAGRGSLLCESGPIYVVSFYLITRHNSLIITGLGLSCLHTSIFIKTPSLEGLPAKAKEDPSRHEMRLCPAGHPPSISWSLGNYYFYYCYYYYILISIHSRTSYLSMLFIQNFV